VRIAIGCDHKGLAYKDKIKTQLESLGHSWEDFGTFTEESVDYPDIARRVAEGVAAKKFDHGILVCTTGQGMSIAANKVPGVRAAVCSDTFSASRTRQHNDANVLCIGAWVVGEGLALEIVKAYLAAEFGGGRHARRLDKIKAIEVAYRSGQHE